MRKIRMGLLGLGVLGLVSGLSSCGGGGGGIGADNASLVHLVTADTPAGATGVLYTEQFEAEFPNSPGVFLVSGGALPSGLDLDHDTGVLSGYPRQVGSYHFSVAARDGIDVTLPPGRDANFAQDARTYSLDIGLGLPHILPQTVPGATYRTSYGYQVDVAGGTAPFTFAQTGGILPAGVTVDPTGFLGSFPTQSQATPYVFQVTVTDALGLQDTATLSLQVIVLPLIILTANPIPQAAQGFPYDLPLALASPGGGVPFTWAQKFPLAPGETNLTAIGMQVTSAGHVSDIGAGPTAIGTFTFSVQVTDEPSQVATRQFSLKVNPGPVLTSISPNRASSPGPFTVTGLNFQAGAQLVFKPGPTATFVSPTNITPTSMTFAAPVPKPSDGSGAVDVMVRNPDGGTNTKTGAFIFPASTLAFATKGFLSSVLSSTGLDCADVNGDGKADIVHCGAAGMTVYSGSSSSTNGGLILHMNLGGSPPTFSSNTLDGASYYDVKFADVNSDGKLDIVAVNAANIRVWINNPLGTFTAGPTTALPSGYGVFPGAISVGNLSSDSIPDIAIGVPHYPWLGFSNINGRAYTMTGTGTGAFVLADSAVSTLTNSYGVIALSCIDTDGDGRAEVAAATQMNPSTGPILRYSPMSTTGFFTTWATKGSITTAPFYASTTGLIPGDFLGTGQPALVAMSTGSPSYSNARVLTLFSGAGLSTTTTLAAPSAVTKCGAALDGDFDASIDWAISQHPGQILIYKGSTKLNVLTLDAAVGSPSISTPLTGRVASGDLDGDGKPDILATTSYWAVSGMAANYGSSYTLGAHGNGGSMGIVFFLNTSN